MAVSLVNIREQLKPGLMAIQSSYTPSQWDTLFEEKIVPVSLPTAIAMSATAVIIRNPILSRRFWRAK